MARILIQVVFPVLLPALLYALWLAAERRRVEAAGAAGEQPRWSEAPWIWLLALGLFFAAIIAVAIAVFGGEGVDGVYIPPHVEDGRVVPGHVAPK